MKKHIITWLTRKREVTIPYWFTNHTNTLHTLTIVFSYLDLLICLMLTVLLSIFFKLWFKMLIKLIA